jgi:hypothetical protein
VIREGLEAEFRAEAGLDGEVLREALALVPDRPKVHVAATVAVPIVGEVRGPAAGRGGPPGPVGIELADYSAKSALVESVVVDDIAHGVFLGFGIPAEGAEVLVVAAPESEAGMVHKSLDLMANFRLDLGEEGRLRGVEGAGEHAILPDEDALLVAEIVEVLGLVAAAAPYAQAVHVGRRRRAQEIVEPLPASSARGGRRPVSNWRPCRKYRGRSRGRSCSCRLRPPRPRPRARGSRCACAAHGPTPDSRRERLAA